MTHLPSAVKSEGTAVSADQAFLVYKYLNTPLEHLTAGMQKMQTQELNQFYRKLAIQLHPDKNRHPQATDAFQVVQSAHDAAKAVMRSSNSGAF